MIFTILTQCLNATDKNNYSIRAKGRWFCLGAMLIGSFAAPHLEDFDKKPDGHNPLSAAEVVQKTFYQSLFAWGLSTLRFEIASWGTQEGREKLSALYNLSIEISKKGCQAGDLLSAFVKADGSAIDRDHRLSPWFDLKEELLSGRVKVLTKTDCLEWPNKEAANHTSYFYNPPSRQLIGNYGKLGLCAARRRLVTSILQKRLRQSY